tara:strand:+ start:8749 stop:9027 length:279 start_codon:yes stop_codon:yes gene_type:complete
MVSARQYIYLLKARDLALLAREQSKIIKQVQFQFDLLQKQHDRCVDKIDYIFENTPFEIEDLDIFDDVSKKRIELQKKKEIMKTFINYRYYN